MHEVDSLPFLEREKKISIQQGENTDRYMLVKEKQSFALLVERERKKSEITSSRTGLEVNGLNYNN